MDIPCDTAKLAKGYLVSVSQRENGQARFHFKRLPSPLKREEEVCESVDIQIPVSSVFKWDICPLLDLVAVATRSENKGCVYLKFPTIESLLTGRTRSLEVEVFKMFGGTKHHDHPMKCQAGAPITESTHILLTSRRLAAMVHTSGTTYKVYAWNLKDGKQYLVSHSISPPKMS